MSCDNLEVPKPLTGACPTNLFGIPYGVAGRVVGGTSYPIAGIVLHCYPGTAAELCNEMKCRTKTSVISGSAENSYHYGIGAGAPGFSQYVADSDISWSFGSYKNNSYVTAPPPNVAVNWPTLQGIYGVNVTPDVYTIDIALAIGHIVQGANGLGCYTCPTASGLPETQHEDLVQMLAYLAQEYEIAIDSEHINFHDNIRCDEGQECPCTDIETLLGEVAAYCPPCEGDEAPMAPEAEVDDEIQYIMGITEACCPDSAGCYVKIPWNACFIGDLAIDGTLDSYILGLTQDPVTEQWCLTRGCLAVQSPIVGCGTVDDPLRLDLCAWGAYIPDQAVETMVGVVGLDAEGCLIETPACDLVTQCETELTVIDTNCIDLTASGVNGHTLQADIVISPDANNQLECLANGLYVSEPDCETMLSLTQDGINIVTLWGDDGGGACGNEGARAFWDRMFCAIEEDALGVPMWVAAETTTECPKFVTPTSIVVAGLSVDSTNCIDLQLSGTGVLTSTPIIDPLAGNLLVCNANGLYVPPMTVAVSNDCISMSIVGNELAVDLVVDPAGDNILECTVNGAYVPDLVPVSSNCISVAYVGRQLTITPIISVPIGGISNQITCEATGLFVPRGAGAAVSPPIIGDGSDANPIDINFSLLDAQDLCDLGDAIPSGVLEDIVGRDAADCLRRETLQSVVSRALVFNDTSTVDLTLTGNVLTADVIVSPAPGNTLIATPTGLFVSPFTVVDTDCLDLSFVGGVLSGVLRFAGPQGGVPNIVNCVPGQGLYVPEGGGLTVVDTSCIDLTLANAVLSAAIILDPTGDNQAQCLPAGLYVPPTAGLIAIDTDCITLNLAGDTLTATPVLAPTQSGVTNALTCLAGEGLFVPGLTVADLLTVQDTDCIDLTLSPAGVLSADPIISPDACNGLTCEADGLFVNNDIQQLNVQSNVAGIAINIPAPGGLPAVPTQYNVTGTLSVSNPSLCNPMSFFRVVQDSTANFINTCGVAPATVQGEFQWSAVSAAGPWNTIEQSVTTSNPGQIASISLAGLSASFTHAVGGTNNVWVRTVFSNPDGNFCGTFSTGDIVITAMGINYIN